MIKLGSWTDRRGRRVCGDQVSKCLFLCLRGGGLNVLFIRWKTGGSGVNSVVYIVSSG